MGLYLIALSPNWELLWVIIQVAVGLGAVIFVHELGHFLVAKLCGVKCEKFYIGFDIGGWKISRQWGETEYGIGILPLGGYVKMLGQDDNPAKIASEMERARLADEDSPEGERAEGAAGQTAGLDPRSYPAKTVPQRMAIISAGVVMNVIFAFIFAATAYKLGVDYIPCVVNEVVPGSPAWRAGLKTGDEIVQIGELKKPRFFQDLKPTVMLGDKQSDVKLTIHRPGEAAELRMSILPTATRGQQTIGITPAASLTLAETYPVLPGSPADRAQPAFEPNDQIVAVAGQRIDSHMELVRILQQNIDKPLTFTVIRWKSPADSSAADPAASGEETTIEVGPNPMKRLGLKMTMGPIVAIQSDSPAERAGLRTGDLIQSVDGQPVIDPITLPEQLRRKAAAGESVVISVRRSEVGSEDSSHEFTIQLRETLWQEAFFTGAPLSAPALGAAFDVLNHVASVEPGSTADRAGIERGEEIVEASLVSGPETNADDAALLAEEKLSFNDTQRNWPAFEMGWLQRLLPGMQVKLTVRKGDVLRDVELTPDASSEWFVAHRGLQLEPLKYVRQAETVGEAIQLGARETKDSLLMVYRFLQRLIDQQISPRLLGGPITIAKVAGHSAYAGPAMLLIFLTVLSANLAVINFLPIPLLDGGHMVLLTAEAVLRRPLSERFVIALHIVGFALIVTLMTFVLALDLGFIRRDL